MNIRAGNDKGFSFVELIIIIVVIGIFASIAMQSMTVLVSHARETATEREMESLAKAIVGDPGITTEGHRSDFGYVGDVGSFPPNLDALALNPGGYSTWKGPYLSSGFVGDNGFKADEWGNTYSYSGGISITSNGGGSTHTKKIADATSDYLSNTINGTVVDDNDSIPGATYMDSVSIDLTIPDGVGGLLTKTYNPDASGNFTFDTIPVGTHPVKIIYLPNVDTLTRFLTVLPRHKSSVRYKFASIYFSLGGLVLVSGTEEARGGGDCDDIRFTIQNTSANSISVSSIKLTFSSPVAYYEEIKWDGDKVFDSNNPRSASGDVSNFNSSETINSGEQIVIEIKKFNTDQNGGGNPAAVNNSTFTVEFSNGSIFNITLGACQ